MYLFKETGPLLGHFLNYVTFDRIYWSFWSCYSTYMIIIWIFIWIYLTQRIEFKNVPRVKSKLSPIHVFSGIEHYKQTHDLEWWRGVSSLYYIYDHLLWFHILSFIFHLMRICFIWWITNMSFVLTFRNSFEWEI